MNIETENKTGADPIAGLAAAACGIAWKSAHAWLVNHNKTANENALALCVRSWVANVIHEAIADSRRAIDCNMTDIAIATFQASMVLAGIEAAKEAEISRN